MKVFHSVLTTSYHHQSFLKNCLATEGGCASLSTSPVSQEFPGEITSERTVFSIKVCMSQHTSIKTDMLVLICTVSLEEGTYDGGGLSVYVLLSLVD